MITFEEVKEMFKKSIDTTNTMNQALENLMQSIYQKGYNDALDKIRAEVAEEICLTDNPYTKETKYTIEHLKLLEILDKYKAESEVK